MKLFTPLTLGGTKDPIALLHRVVMAPLTRLRTGEEGVQTPLGATYYAQRTTRGGLIIAEATNISPTARGAFGSPGIFSQEQISAWRVVTDAVHAGEGRIFLQLWHTGRASHPLNQPDNRLPVSSSNKLNHPQAGKKISTRDGRVDPVNPRALATDEIPGVVQDYKTATMNALAAGFDGVELHAANGYLLEHKVGIRLSPFGVSYGDHDSDPVATYSYVLNKLNDYDLAYAHLIEPRGYHTLHPQAPKDGAARLFRSVYKGVLMTASGYERESAVQVVERGDADLVAMGRYFISNPDLVARFQQNAALTPFDLNTFYHGDARGYTDYPFL
ncbi:hypothetical protein PybrP1_002150 [[Pythium] brassicae (nom. inval.)]|nr:hypothetical protein PybrP1_002150 [[Pythium] brassicae (nom. inval.)]